MATEREAAVSVQYAAPQPDASPRQDDIFCQRCLKNQHLFTKSLAQYLPDDPADPDYPELERNYYRYRRNLEARYPQVCGDCADKVEERIRQAGYTAKTDHLRRMMNLTRRRKTRTRSKLDWVDTLGRFLWRMGFATQALWHCQAVAQALQETESGIRDPDAGRSTLAAAASALQLGADVLPSSETAITWSLRLAFLAAWWNPHFVQVNRGFARHLLGFTQWYSIQGLIIFFRFIFRSLDTSPHTAASPTARLGRHVAMAAVTLMVRCWLIILSRMARLVANIVADLLAGRQVYPSRHDASLRNARQVPCFERGQAIDNAAETRGRKDLFGACQRCTGLDQRHASAQNSRRGLFSLAADPLPRHVARRDEQPPPTPPVRLRSGRRHPGTAATAAAPAATSPLRPRNGLVAHDTPAASVKARAVVSRAQHVRAAQEWLRDREPVLVQGAGGACRPGASAPKSHLVSPDGP